MPDYPQAALDAAALAIHRAACPLRDDPDHDCARAVPFGADTTRAAAALDAAAPLLAEPYEELLAAIWLYIPWRFVTKQLTTAQKELFADAVNASSRRLAAREGPSYGPASRAERWWEGDYAEEEQ